MKDEARIWLDYSRENLESAEILLASSLFNPCLQNSQQCVEKALKALLLENSIRLKKTHSIAELKNIIYENKIEISITEEESEFLDSIYLPSKYPLNSVLPYFMPDQNLCEQGIAIAKKVYDEVNEILK
ncbi:MAG: HEPN domain-containing protein [bacterium]|jgi:HEPN domain-containing protein|nr:HEPN domain-containing protein [bacterium]